MIMCVERMQMEGAARKRACLDADAAPPSESEDELAQLRARCAAQEQALEEMRHRVLQLEWREELWRDVAGRAVSARETARMAPYVRLDFEINCMAVASDGLQYICTQTALWRKPPGGAAALVAGHRTMRGFADGVGAGARFNDPNGIALDEDGGRVFIADTNNHAIRIVDTQKLAVTTLAGNGNPGLQDGVAGAARFHQPWGIVLDPHRGVFVTDSDNHAIRRVDPTTGTVTTLAGKAEEGLIDGPGREARFSSPSGLALYAPGCLVVSDSENHCLRMLTLDEGGGCRVLTIDTHGRKNFYTFWNDHNRPFLARPQGLTVDGQNNIVVASSSCLQLIRLAKPLPQQQVLFDRAAGRGIKCQPSRDGGQAGGYAKSKKDGPAYTRGSDTLRTEAETTLLAKTALQGIRPCALALDERGRILVAGGDNRGQLHRVCTDLPWALARVLYIGALKGDRGASAATSRRRAAADCRGGQNSNGGRRGGGRGDLKIRCVFSLLPQAGRVGCPLLAHIIRMIQVVLPVNRRRLRPSAPPLSETPPLLRPLRDSAATPPLSETSPVFHPTPRPEKPKKAKFDVGDNVLVRYIWSQDPWELGVVLGFDYEHAEWKNHGGKGKDGWRYQVELTNTKEIAILQPREVKKAAY
jgi:sugar lactone lactonase YvrE